MDSITSHLTNLLLGRSNDQHTFNGKTLRLNLKIGNVVLSGFGSGNAMVSFEPLSFEQILRESRDQ